MGTPLDPRSQSDGTPDPGHDFVAAWAALVQALESRAPSDAAVDAVVSAALRAHEACGTGETLRVQFAPGEVCVGERTFAVAPGSQAARLAERLQACGVAGALFEPGLRAPSLVALSRQVLEQARRAAHLPGLEAWQGEPVEHVHVLQQRFEDLFGDAETSGGELLRHVVEALPEGALDDPQVASESVFELVHGDAHAGWDDDAVALQAELAALPEAPADLLEREPLHSPAESLGVELHQLLALEDGSDAAHLQTRLANHLRMAGDEERDVLASYVEPLRDDAPEPADAHHRRRLTGFLRDFDLTAVLAEHGAFGLELALERFPDDLGLWLDGLALETGDGHRRACALFERVGTEGVLRAGQVVVAEGRLADPERAGQLLGRAHPALVPVARLLLARGVPRLTRQVARFVRDLDRDEPEAASLALLDDDELPAEVLAGLLDPPRTPTARAALRRRVAECLCEQLELEGAEAARRVALARHAAGYAEARARLADLALRERGPGGDARLAEELERLLEREDAP